MHYHWQLFQELKKFFNNKKEELRKNLAIEKRELYRMGGGLPPAQHPRDGADQLLVNIIIEKSLYGVPSSIAPFDGDYICIDDDRETDLANVNIEVRNNFIFLSYDQNLHKCIHSDVSVLIISIYRIKICVASDSNVDCNIFNPFIMILALVVYSSIQHCVCIVLVFLLSVCNLILEF